MNCLSVFDHFVGFARKRLKRVQLILTQYFVSKPFGNVETTENQRGYRNKTDLTWVIITK